MTSVMSDEGSSTLTNYSTRATTYMTSKHICIAVSLQYCNWRYQELVDPYMSISDSLNSFGNCDLTKGNINREGDEANFFDDYTMHK